MDDGPKAGVPTLNDRRKAAEVIAAADAEKATVLEQAGRLRKILASLEEEKKRFPHGALRRQREVERLRRAPAS